MLTHWVEKENKVILRRTTATAALALWAALAAGQQVYVANYADGTIQRYSTSGTWLGTFADTGDAGPLSLAWHDGDLYVAAYNDDQILEYNLEGEEIGVFAHTVSNPKFLLFNGAGDLYVSTLYGPGTTATIQEFAPDGSLIQNISAQGERIDELTWGPGGNLYGTSFIDSDIQEYDPTTGAFLGYFTSLGESGVESEGSVVFDSAGDAFTDNTFSSYIYELNGAGEQIASWYNPAQFGQGGGAMEFFTLNDGILYTVDSASNNIWMYDESGNSLGLFTATNLNEPYEMVFGPNAGSAVPGPAAALSFGLAALWRRRQRSR